MKQVNNETMTQVTGVTNETSLSTFFEQYTNVSLRKLAKVTGVTYGVLLNYSKKPIPGTEYDPTQVNWEAIDGYLGRKGVQYDTLPWDEMNQVTGHQGGTLCKDIEKFPIGTLVYLRRDNEVPFEVVYRTDTHIVLVKQGTTEPVAWSHSTFFMQGPAFEPRAITTTESEQA